MLMHARGLLCFSQLGSQDIIQHLSLSHFRIGSLELAFPNRGLRTFGHRPLQRLLPVAAWFSNGPLITGSGSE